MQHTLQALVLTLLASTVPAIETGLDALQKSDCTLQKDGDNCEKPIRDCTAVRVLEDVATGWVDKCEDLAENLKAKTKTACGDQCRASVNCSVWQWSGVGEELGGHCYSGVPDKGCRTRDGFKADAGQRLQHGEVAVTGSALGMEVMNLMAFQMDAANTEGQAVDEARCKQACHTDTTCTVWQYGQKTGALGCWMEHLPDNKAGSINRDPDNAFSQAVTAGEFILHYCPVDPAAAQGDMWLWLGPLLGVIGLALIFGPAMFLLKKKPKVKKTRAVKLAPQEEEVVPLWVPQPTVLIPQAQPTMVYQQVQQPLMQTGPVLYR